jgi:hypothetical protein
MGRLARLALVCGFHTVGSDCAEVVTSIVIRSEVLSFFFELYKRFDARYNLQTTPAGLPNKYMILKYDIFMIFYLLGVHSGVGYSSGIFTNMGTGMCRFFYPSVGIGILVCRFFCLAMWVWDDIT